MARTSKQFKKFASSGKLKDTIKSRRQHQQIRRKAEDRITRREKQRGPPRTEHRALSSRTAEDGEASEGEDVPLPEGRAGGVAKSVEELFGGKIDGEVDDASELEDLSEEEQDGLSDGDEEEEGVELDEEAMQRSMKALAKKDPEFFEFLKENDRHLLDFGRGEGPSRGRNAREVSVDREEQDVQVEGNEDMEEEDLRPATRKTSVTLRMLRQWQEGMIKQHSVRSLRKMLLAFRAAALLNDSEGEQGSGSDLRYTVDDPAVFNKLIVTALRYTPVVIAHHMPFKTQPNGKIKLQPPKTSSQNLTRLTLSHFTTLLTLIRTLPTRSSAASADFGGEAGDILAVAVSESTRMIPWIMGARKYVRAYLKLLLDLWSSAGDPVRIAAFLAIRKLFIAGDDAIKDLVLRQTYRSLLPPLRHTTPHTIPSLNLMKNTASELFQLEPARSYSHSFSFIRMLAVQLRAVVRTPTTSTKTPDAKKGKSKDRADAFRSVYNWQFVHCLDFWSKVLGGACSSEGEKGGDSSLRPLIYPLVQIALGVIRLLPSPRYFPLRFHVLHSFIALGPRTNTYIPLAPFMTDILLSPELTRPSPRKTTLKPLDFEYIIRAPQTYLKTRIYQDSLTDELAYTMGEYFASQSNRIAFPEMVLPVIVTVKRVLKKGTSPKVSSSLKILLEKIEATRKWTEAKRRDVQFAPRDWADVKRWEAGVEVDKTPIGTWMAVQRKMRARKRKEVEAALRERAEEMGGEEEEEADGEMEDEDAEMDMGELSDDA